MKAEPSSREVGAMLDRTEPLFRERVKEHPSDLCPRSLEIQVYRELWRWANIDGYIGKDEKTVGTLCKDLFISDRTARRAISCLRARGLLFFGTRDSILSNVCVLAL